MQNQTTLLASLAHQAMLDHGLEPDFTKQAEQQLTTIDAPANENSAAIRDLRNLSWCSIDNDDSRDLDQLTIAEDKGQGDVRIMIAVADVDALVKRSTPIDDHAEKNTTSVYTAAKIFPMLPEKLSTNLTSLNEGEDRIAMVVDILVAADGSVGAGDG
jgi:exoribonuclease-2